MQSLRLQTSAFFIVMIAFSGIAYSHPVTLKMEWREASVSSLTHPNTYIFGPGSMEGTFTFDSSLIASFAGQPPISPFFGTFENPSIIPLHGNPLVFDLHLAVHNSDGFDGNWGIDDFENFVVHTLKPLDFSQELVGQPIFGSPDGCLFGVSTDSDCYAHREFGTFLFAPTATTDFPGRVIYSIVYDMPPYGSQANMSSQPLYFLSSVRLRSL